MMSDQSMDIEEMPDIGAIGGENFNQLGSYDQAYMLAPQNVQVDEHGNTEQFFNLIDQNRFDRSTIVLSNWYQDRISILHHTASKEMGIEIRDERKSMILLHNTLFTVQENIKNYLSQLDKDVENIPDDFLSSK